MSHTHSPAAIARDARQLLRRTTAHLSGRSERGPDHSDDPNRRVPRRHSYEETDVRARPWSRIGDGSVLQGVVYKETLAEAAEELRQQLWREYPLAEIRRRRDLRDVMSAELDELLARSPADRPVGRPAALRAAITEHDAWLEKADGRLRRIDVDVLRGLLAFLTDFATGKLFPSIEAIAQRAGVAYNSAVDGLRRLRAHGLIDWVRRTTRTGNAGEAGPQLEQTSNAYTVAPCGRMADRTRHRYLQRLAAKLRRLRGPGGPSRPLAEPGTSPADAAPLSPLQAAVASLGATLHSANP